MQSVGDLPNGAAFAPKTGTAAKRSGVSRATIYRYMSDLFLFRPAGRNRRGAFFTVQHVRIVRVIKRLNRVHRFRLAEIRETIIPDFTQDELARMDGFTDKKIGDLLRRKEIRFKRR